MIRVIPRALGIAFLAVLGVVCGRPSSPRVLRIGLDGADPEILERLLTEGRFPTFAKLKGEGAFGPLRSREPLLSPIVWTTIATGRKAADHGVLDFVELTEKRELVPITSERRRVAALWNVASEFRVPFGFVGWCGSYPAEDILGFEVSDRLAFHRSEASEPPAERPSPNRLPPRSANTSESRVPSARQNRCDRGSARISSWYA